MTTMYVLKRANGDLFTQEIDRKFRIPVWASDDEVARYKARNPELSVYLPVRLDRSSISKLNASGAEGAIEFFQLDANDPDANLNVGRPIMQEELFPESEAASAAALLPA